MGLLSSLEQLGGKAESRIESTELGDGFRTLGDSLVLDELEQVFEITHESNYVS
jgi:hypothetical protein